MLNAKAKDLRLSLSAAIKNKIEAIITALIIRFAKEKIEEEFIPLFKEKAIEVYRRDLVSREGAWGKKDPTSPSKLESTFISYMNANAKKLVKITDKGVYLSRKYLSDFGFPGGISKDETSKQKLLFFYFSGIIGTFGFVDKRIFEKMTGRPGENLGRFGEGFFIEKGTYQKIEKRVEGLPRFSEIESPLSGTSGVDVVARAFNESVDNMSSILRFAAKKAVEEFNKG